MNDVRLETPRLILREHREDDWRGVLAYASDPRVQQYLKAPLATEGEVRASLARTAAQRQETPRTRYELAITLRDGDSGGDTPIGWIPLLLTVPDRLYDAEIGWTLAHAYWGCGYATEAARAVLAFAFETLELHRVWAVCEPQNGASERVMQKLGMRREGCFVRARRVRDRWIDSVQYALLEDEWWAARREVAAGSGV